MNSFPWVVLQWKFFGTEVEKEGGSTVEGAWKWRRKLDFKVRAVIGTVRGKVRVDLIVQELVEHSGRFGAFIVHEPPAHWFSIRLANSGNLKEAARHWLREYETSKESTFSLITLLYHGICYICSILITQDFRSSAHHLRGNDIAPKLMIRQ
jgi:hypothetical protein